jgi:hypothetical protein
MTGNACDFGGRNATSLISEVVQWEVYRRRSARDGWMQYAIESSEHNGRGVLEDAQSAYPTWEMELRKVTITEERVDG